MSLEHPNYYSDQRLYDELWKEQFNRELTQEEHDFVNAMYHLEEYYCGLDGEE